MTPRYHQPKELLNLSREMAKKVMQLKKDLRAMPNADPLCIYEIDDLASMSQMILLEVEHRKKE